MIKKQVLHQSEELALIDNVFGTLPFRLALEKNMEKVDSRFFSKERTIWHCDVKFDLGPIRTTNNIMLMSTINGMFSAFLEDKFATGQNTFTIGYPTEEERSILIKCKKVKKKEDDALRLSIHEINEKGEYVERSHGLLYSYLLPAYQDMFRKAIHWAAPAATFYKNVEYDRATLNKCLDELKPKWSLYDHPHDD